MTSRAVRRLAALQRRALFALVLAGATLGGFGAPAPAQAQTITAAVEYRPGTTVQESVGSLRITLTVRTDGLVRPQDSIVLNVATSDGTATSLGAEKDFKGSTAGHIFRPEHFNPASDGTHYQSVRIVSLPIFDDPLAEGTETFQVVVRRLLSGGFTSHVGTATITILDNDQAPGGKPVLTASAGDRQVTLGWTPLAVAGTSPIGGYEYRRSDDGGANWDPDWTAIPMSAPGGAYASGYTVTGLTNGTAYTFELRARSAAGASAASDRVTATPVLGGPSVTGDAVWAAVLTSGQHASGPHFQGFGSGYDGGALTPNMFQVGTTTYTVQSLIIDEFNNRLFFGTSPNLSASAVAGWTLSGGGGDRQFSRATFFPNYRPPVWRWTNVTYDWDRGGNYPFRIIARPNAAAGGAPVIRGTAWVGRPLTVDTTGITDADGTTRAEAGDAGFAYDYQWIRTENGVDGDIAGANSSTYTPARSDAGVTIKVRVRFRDDSGKAETAISAATAPVGIDPPPPAPNGLAAAPGDTEVALSWDAPGADAGITGHEYRYKTGTGDYPDSWTPIADSAPGGTNQAGVTVAGLGNGRAHTFQVRAVNDTGEGPASDGASATPIPALAIEARARTPEHGRSIQICAVPSNPSFSQITFTLTIADGTATATEDYTGTAVSALRLSPRQQRSCISVDVVDDRLVEEDEDFTATLSDIVGATPGMPLSLLLTIVDNDVNAPAAPANLTAATGDAEATLSWDAPAADAVIAYHEYRYKTDRDYDNWYVIPMSAPGETNQAGYTVPGLTNGETHTFQVRAANAGGTSDPSNEANARVGAGLGVCDRTRQVREGIIAAINGVTDCARVTAAHLAGPTNLNLSGSGLTALKAGDFSGLSSLTRLDLTYNQLSALPAEVFSGLSSLTQLDLTGNELSALPPEVFSGLSSLTRLDLTGNELSALPAEVFSGLSSLTWLYLGSNLMSALPAGVFSGLSSLTELYLDGNV